MVHHSFCFPIEMQIQNFLCFVAKENTNAVAVAQDCDISTGVNDIFIYQMNYESEYAEKDKICSKLGGEVSGNLVHFRSSESVIYMQ